MESVCVRSPFHDLLLKPSKSFNKFFHDTVYFNRLTQRRTPVNQCFCLKKCSLISVSGSETCDARAKTVRPIATNKITHSCFPVLISLTIRQTHEQPLKEDGVGSHIWGAATEKLAKA